MVRMNYRYTLKKFIGLALLGALVVFLASCSLNLLKAQSGSVHFFVPHSRGALAAAGITITTWKLSGAGPSGAQFRVSASGSQQQVDVTDIVVGSWSITVQGFDDQNNAVYGKTAAINIVAGNNDLSVTLDVLITSIGLDNLPNLAIGGKKQLVVTVSPGNVANSILSFASSNTGVATVDQTGTVTGVATGTATITASATDGSGKSGTCTVTVVPPNPLVAEWDFENFLKNQQAVTDEINNISLSFQSPSVVDSTDSYNSYYGLGLSYSYATFAANPYSNKAGPWSVALWINPSSFETAGVILSSKSGNGIVLQSNGNGAVEVGIGSDNFNTISPFTDLLISQSSWSHIVVVNTGTQVNLYVNGVLSGTTLKDAKSVACTLPLDTLGAAYDGTNVSDTFGASVDDLNIYNAALSAADVATLYQSYPFALNLAITYGGQTGFNPGQVIVDIPPDIGGLYYTYGTTVTLTAVPDTVNYYIFNTWLDSLTSNPFGATPTNPILIVPIKTNVNITADFGNNG